MKSNNADQHKQTLNTIYKQKKVRVKKQKLFANKFNVGGDAHRVPFSDGRWMEIKYPGTVALSPPGGRRRRSAR